MTVLFADLRGFTRWTEDVDPQTVSAIFQGLERDGSEYGSESATETTDDRWLNAVDEYFLHDDSDLLTW